MLSIRHRLSPIRVVRCSAGGRPRDHARIAGFSTQRSHHGPSKRTTSPSGRLVVLEHESVMLVTIRSATRTCARSASGCRRSTTAARRQGALPGALRPRRLHRLGSVARRLEAFRRQRGGARGAPDPRTEDGPGDHRASPIASPRSAATSTSIRRRSATTPTTSRASSSRSSTASSARSPRASIAAASASPPAATARSCHAMKYPQYWGAIADHSGDAYFDFVYWHDWPNTLNELAKHRARAARPGRTTRAESSRKRPGRGARRRAHQALPRKVWKKEKLVAPKATAS